MKKLAIGLVGGLLVFSLVAGCGQKEEAAAPAETPVVEETPAPAMENMTTAEAEAPAETPAEEAPAAH